MDFVAIMERYFSGEKSEAGVFLLISIALLLLSAYFVFSSGQPFLKGMGAVLILAATVGIIVGATVYFRTDSQLTALVGSFEEDCAAFKRVEGERMSTVMTSFGTYRLMYAAFLVISLVLQFTTKKPYWAGFAVGLLAFAALGLVVDHYAEHRGHVYVDAIDSLQCDDPPSG